MTLVNEGYYWDCFGFRVKQDTLVVLNAFANEENMCIAEVDYTHGVHLGREACVQLSVQRVEDQVVLSELCTLRSVCHWCHVWCLSFRRKRLKREQREKSLASRVMMQYCRGVEDATTLLHSFLSKANR